MSALRNIKDGIGKAWDNFSHEWSQFMDKTSGALTRFTPMKKEEEVSGSKDLANHSPRIGFMATEVMESEDSVVARIEAPGMEAGDFTVEVVGDNLVIKGSKSMKREEKKGHYHVMECAYGSFTRSVPLPTEVEVSKAKAKYKNGVLEITLPKTESGKRKRIEVKVN